MFHRKKTLDEPSLTSPGPELDEQEHKSSWFKRVKKGLGVAVMAIATSIAIALMTVDGIVSLGLEIIMTVIVLPVYLVIEIARTLAAVI